MEKRAPNKFGDETMDASLVVFIDGYPYCKEHGAMNKINDIWRCFAMYKGNADGVYPKGMAPIKFVSRVCNAATFIDGVFHV